MNSCFHCGLDAPDETLVARVQDRDEPVCCLGCKAVAELIDGSGLASYYALRDAPTAGAPPESGRYAQYATSEANYVANDGEFKTATVFIEGMHCSACCWLVESALGRLDAVTDACVDPVSHRLTVNWRDMPLVQLLEHIDAIGYRPHPMTGDSEPETLELRQSMKRLVVASLGMMQVMMFAIGLYSGAAQGISADMEHFLRLVSLAVTIPVVAYSARPIFIGALRGIAARQLGMDVPVALAISLAWLGSVYSTFTHGSDVWFDSVAMFVFFLTLARHFELKSRINAGRRADALCPLLPGTAERIVNGAIETVPSSCLEVGDHVRVKPGSFVPVDAVLQAERATFDESVLTGESEGVVKQRGDTIVAGSICLDASVTLEALRTGNDTVLGQIRSIAQKASRPAALRLADRVASYFVAAVLVVSCVVAASWAILDPDRALVVTLSVLVITCPCALSLATPTVFTAASQRFANAGLLLTRNDALAALAKIDTVIFDKTGTLSSGQPSVVGCETVQDEDADAVFRIAAALERHSAHPLARAFACDSELPDASDVRTVPGLGIEGIVDGRRWRLGTDVFAQEIAAEAAPTVNTAEAPCGRGFSPDSADATTSVCLANDAGVKARFSIADALRPESAAVVRELKNAGIDVQLLSGDRPSAVAAAATELGIASFTASQRPEDKLDAISKLQRRGRIVLMIGDGINDGPVLAAADASMAMASGADLARHQSDIVMTRDELGGVLTAISGARDATRILRQNLVWAVSYNALALPAAAMGIVPTWLAAIGMSASSLVVVVNAMRAGSEVDQNIEERESRVHSSLTPELRRSGASA